MPRIGLRHDVQVEEQRDHIPRARPQGRDRRRPRGAGHRRAVSRPGRDHRGRPRRARRLRQGQDRIGQDARVRPSGHPDHPGLEARPPHRLGARPDARARQAGRRRAEPDRQADRRARRRVLRRHLDGPPDPQPLAPDRGRGRDSGPADRPARAGRARPRPDRDPHHRRGRPHGRHGLPAPGRMDHAQGPERPPDALVLGHPRPRGRRAGAALHAIRSCTRSCPKKPTSTRCCTAS